MEKVKLKGVGDGESVIFVSAQREMAGNTFDSKILKAEKREEKKKIVYYELFVN